MRLRPMRSDRCPNSGIETNDTTEAASTAISSKSRDTFSDAGAVGEDERGEDVERRLLGHAAQRRQEDLLRVAA